MSVEETYQAFMLDYTSGALPRGLALAAELHRLFSAEGGEVAEIWETVRKELVNSGLPSATRGKLVGDVNETIHLVFEQPEDIHWRRGLSGASYSDRKIGEGRLMRLDPGQSVMKHGHSALEATVVLEGALEDGHGVYKVGDVILATPGMSHRPAAYGNRTCTCFVAKGKTAFWRLT